MNKRYKLIIIIKDIINYFVYSSGILFLIILFDSKSKEQILKIGDISNLIKVILCIDLFLIFLIDIILGKGNKYEKTYRQHFDKVRALIFKKNANNNNTEDFCEEKMLVSLHEAGHAVVALLLGVEVISTEINFEEAVSGKTITKEKLGSLDEEYLKKLVLIKYAGAATEKFIYGKYGTGCIGSCHSDFSRAEEFIKNMLLISPEKYDGYVQSGEKFNNLVYQTSLELFTETQKLVVQNIDSIKKIGEELIHRKNLNEKEILEIIS